MNHMSRIIKQIPAFPTATAEPEVPPGAQEPMSPSVLGSFQMSRLSMDGGGHMDVDEESMGIVHKNEVRLLNSRRILGRSLCYQRSSLTPPFMQNNS